MAAPPKNSFFCLFTAYYLFINYLFSDHDHDKISQRVLRQYKRKYWIKVITLKWSYQKYHITSAPRKTLLCKRSRSTPHFLFFVKVRFWLNRIFSQALTSTFCRKSFSVYFTKNSSHALWYLWRILLSCLCFKLCGINCYSLCLFLIFLVSELFIK